MTKCEVSSRGYCIAVMNVIGLGGMFCLLCIVIDFGLHYGILDISPALKVSTSLGLIVCFGLFIFCFVSSCINDRTLHMITTCILVFVAIANFGFGLGVVITYLSRDETLANLIDNISRNYDKINQLELAFSCCRWEQFLDPQCLVTHGEFKDCFSNISEGGWNFMVRVAPGFFGITLCLIICLSITCCLFCRENRGAVEYTSQAGVSLDQLSQTLVPQDADKAHGQTW